MKLAGSWGLKDIYGNIQEWCWDWWGTYPVDMVIDYTGSETGSDKVIRGGHWNASPQACRSADRTYINPGGRNVYIGFRLVRTIS